MLETLDHTIRIGSTPTFLYFDLYLHSAYAAHYVYYIYTVRFLLISLRNLLYNPPKLTNTYKQTTVA